MRDNLPFDAEDIIMLGFFLASILVVAAVLGLAYRLFEFVGGF